MTDPVTLEYLEQLDVAIAELVASIDYYVARLAGGRHDLEQLRAVQAAAVAAYNRQAARPLTP